MKELIDSLVDARLFVADADEKGAATVGVAHEALLHCWPRMAEAIAQDQEFLRARARILRAATRWKEENEDPELMLPSGKQLEEGREILADRSDEIGELEQSFIQRSSDAERHQQRRRLRRLQTIAAGFAVLAIAVGAAGIYARRQQQIADVRRQHAVELRASADALINNTLYDLRTKLTPLGKLDLMEEVSKEAEAYFSAIPAELRDDSTQRQRGTVLNWRGNFFLSLGKTSEAINKFEESLEITRALRAANPDRVEYARDLSVTLSHLGLIARQQGDFSRAEKLLNEVLSLRVIGNAPEALEALDRIETLMSLGDICRDRGDWLGATARYEEAVEIGKDIYFSPELRAQARIVPAALSRLSSARLDTGSLREAQELAEQALEITETLAEQYPDELLFQSDLTVALGHSARMASNNGDAKLARQRYDRRLALAREVFAKNPRDIVSGVNLLHAINGAGFIRMGDEDPNESMGLYEEGAEIARRLFADAPENRELPFLLATQLTGLAFGQMKTGDHKSLIATSTEALDALDAIENLDIFIRDSYRTAYSYLITGYKGLGKTDDDLHPVYRLMLEKALQIEAAGLGDEKLTVGFDVVREILGEPWDRETAIRESEERIAQLDATPPNVNTWASYDTAYRRLIHAHKATGAPEEEIRGLYRRGIAAARRVKEAGLGNGVVENAITFMSQQAGVEEEPK